MQALTDFLGPRLHVVYYEDLVQNHARGLSKLTAFLGLRTPIPPGAVRNHSLDRWRAELSDRQIDEIDEILGDTRPALYRDPPPRGLQTFS
jgi:hypothetical protein